MKIMKPTTKKANQPRSGQSAKAISHTKARVDIRVVTTNISKFITHIISDIVKGRQNDSV